MKTRVIIFAIMLVLIPVSASSQIGGLLKKGASKVMNSVGKAASKEAAREVDSIAQQQADKAVDKAADDIRESRQTSDEQGQRPAGGGFGSRLFGNEVTSKYNPEYKFQSRMNMLMEIFDNGKPTGKMDYNVYFGQTIPNAGIEMKTIAESDGETTPLTVQMIVDGINKSFIMVTDMGTMKFGLISQMPSDSALKSMEAASGTVVVPKVTKTGNTKVIAGYKCDEYLYQLEGEKEYSKMWMTKDAILKLDKNVWSKAGMPAAYGYAGFEGMVTMGFENYDEKNKLISRSEVKEINLNYPHTMSVAGTTFRQVDFSKISRQQGQK